MHEVTAPNADLLVDDYGYLKPPDPEMTLAEYDRFLSERYDQLHDVARLYGEMLHAVQGEADGASGRLLQHWERYMDAASTVCRVRRELEMYGKLPAGYEVTGDTW